MVSAMGHLCDSCCLVMTVYFGGPGALFLDWIVYVRGPVCGPVCEALPGGRVGLAVAENPDYGPMWKLRKGPVGGRRAMFSSRRCSGDE